MKYILCLFIGSVAYAHIPDPSPADLGDVSWWSSHPANPDRIEDHLYTADEIVEEPEQDEWYDVFLPSKNR